MRSHSGFVCKQTRCCAVLCSVLERWSSVRQTPWFCLTLLSHTNLALFTKLFGVQRSFTCIHIRCKLICKSVFSLKVKAKGSSDLLSSQLQVKFDMLKKEMKPCYVCFCLLPLSHHPTLAHSFLSINTLFVFRKCCLNWSFSAGFSTLSEF